LKQDRKKKQADPLIYVGPSLSNGLLGQYTTFRGGVPAHLSELVGTNEAISALMVPVGELAEVRARIAQPGTPEHQYFETLRGV